MGLNFSHGSGSGVQTANGQGDLLAEVPSDENPSRKLGGIVSRSKLSRPH